MPTVPPSPSESAELDRLVAILQAGSREELASFLGRMQPWDAAQLILRLPREQGLRALLMLPPAAAAKIIEEVPDPTAGELICSLVPDVAADLLDEMYSDETVDLLQALSPGTASRILARMEPERQRQAIRLLGYARKTAGGLMMAEYISFPQSCTAGEVIRQMRQRTADYSRFRITYVYVVDDRGRLVALLPLRDLILAAEDRPIGEIARRDIVTVPVDLGQEEVARMFGKYHYLALPVVDDEGRMLGVISQDDALRVLEQEAGEDLLKFSGIVGGEETHQMPLLRRCRGRLAWLVLNIFLNLLAATIIWAHEETLLAVIGVAMFLPIVSDMSGCTGSQSIAVAIRELAAGRVRTAGFLRVWVAEAPIGLVNGLVTGALLGGMAWVCRGDPLLGIIVGGALWVNSIIAVSCGVLIPLGLQRLRIDPALAASPILTTVTDLCGFLLVLQGAARLVA